MNRVGNKFRRAKFAAPLCGSFALCLIAISAAKDRPERVNLFPRVQAGQVLAYQISYHSDKHVNTQSSVIVATPDNSEKTDVNALLRLEILAVQVQRGHAFIRARSKFGDSDSPFNAAHMKPVAEPVSKQDSHEKFVQFTILPDGNLDQIAGLDAFLPEQQQAWQEWASRFLLAAAVRGPGVRLAQKWTSEEAETSSSPIAGLRWVRESTYVRDEPCRTMQRTALGSLATSDAEPETCAVILTNAILKQNSKAKNTTPEDFKLHELRTTGTAQGANRIITYISLKTGLLIRATEEATQQMTVTVAKADGSNRVHYDVNAKSRSEIVMVSEPPLNNP
jgi:hypothetical protein